jgi:hypothetical protein
MLKTVSTQLALASDTLPEVLAKGNTTGGTDLAVSSGDDITFADNSKAIFGAGSDISIYSDGSTGQVTGNVNVTGTLTTTGAATFAGAVGANTTGAAIALTQTATGSATYYVMDNTIETGGKRWRFGYTGAAALSTFSLYNATDDVTAWVSDASGNLSPTGNVVLANGKGIDFSATAGTGTSELLDDYEEGTWTPVGNGVTLTLNTTASYIKVGTLVTVFWDATWPATANASAANVTGLPFTVLAGGGSAVGYTNSGLEVHYNVGGSTTLAAYLNTAAAVTNAQMSGARIIVSGSYTVS